MASQSLLLKPTSSRKQAKTWERRRASVELPERFREEDDDGEDAVNIEGTHPAAYVQQSMYGIMAAAHSKANLRAGLNPDSGSDTETEAESSRRNSREFSRTDNEMPSRVSTFDERQKEQLSRAESGGHRRNKTPEDKTIRSMLKPIRERSDSRAQDLMTQSQFLPSKELVAEETDQPRTANEHDTSAIDTKAQAHSRGQMELSTASESRKQREDTISEGTDRRKAPRPLPKVLAGIFGFDEPEEVISDYACWYLQSVLLQGHMYITQKHVCFYAYLQKKGNVVKSGQLSKQGKRNPRYRRYWFTLKDDVLSYYANSAELYFPSGSIDLRFGISADLILENDQEKNKDAAIFTVKTETRTYFLRADSVSSAKEWIRQLQKVIFHSRNDGDSVKISLPLRNIVDVEPASVLDFEDTVKIRVIDNDATYAVDEYLFTFFSHGKDAIDVLSTMTQGNDTSKAAVEATEEQRLGRRTSSRRSISTDRAPQMTLSGAPSIAEPVRSTLSPSSTGPMPSPRLNDEQTQRSSGEVSRTSFDRRRASSDRGRRSVSATSTTHSQSWRPSRLSPSAERSTDSSLPSSEPEGRAMDMSASQVLTGDAVFGAPTLKIAQPRRAVSVSTVDQLQTEPRESSPHSPSVEQVRNQVPPGAQRDETPAPGPTAIEKLPKPRPEKQVDAQSRSNDTHAPFILAKRAIANPLQQAYNLADVVRLHGKRMSSYLSSSPKSYLDKFSGAIAGETRHYSEPDGLAPEDHIADTEDDLGNAEDERRFQEHFSLPPTERLRAAYYCWLHRVLPLYGKVYISDRRFCFRSLLYGTRTKLVVPYRDIEDIRKENLRFRYPGMVLVIRGHEELFFDFGLEEVRDDCVVTALRRLDAAKAALEPVILTDKERFEAQAAATENELLRDARKDDGDQEPRNMGRRLTGTPTMLFDDPNASVLDFRPKTSLRITCLTIGSRGDVQPYIALCKGFKEHGHQVKIATHTQFEGWIREHGIDFAAVEGDPAELMRICVENGMFTPSFVVETHTLLRGWMDKLLTSSWKACQNSDLLIESPSAMSGIHIAEALAIPYFRAFGMPWTKTRAYPHAFATSGVRRSGQYNYMTYVLFDNFFWQFSSGHINRWRRKTLNLGPTDLGKLQPNKVPFLYNFSPSVVPPPLDFSDWIRVTGYWFLDEGDEWTPPDDLLAFIKRARDDKMKLVYVGFGSVPVSDSRALTQQVIDAVLKADVRCIFSKGWSDHFDQKDATAPELPPSIFQVRSVPHDWLFQRIDAAVHHGGCGTTGASLRAGLPTVIKPFFGDQFFFGTRVEDLGVGMYVRKVTVNALGKAIWLAAHDERMRKKAQLLGERIRQENGVETAITAIYRDLEYARTLIKNRHIHSADAGEGDDTEESWTFVENDSDVGVPGARLPSGLS